MSTERRLSDVEHRVRDRVIERHRQALAAVIPRLEEEHKRPLVTLLRAVAAGEEPDGDPEAMRAAWIHLLEVVGDEAVDLFPIPGMIERVATLLEAT